ncbi:MAG: hypothetical protein GY861_03510 [bacterium]|nr:hypothetical protein [bacterium]
MEPFLLDFSKEIGRLAPVIIAMWFMIKNLREKITELNKRFNNLSDRVLSIQLESPISKITHQRELLDVYKNETRKELNEIRAFVRDIDKKIGAAFRQIDNLNGKT